MNPPATRIVLALSLFLLLGACDSLVQVGEAIRDDDGDSWFHHANNQRAILRVKSIVVDQDGAYFIRAEHVRLPLAASLSGAFAFEEDQITDLDLELTTRTIGTWLLDAPDQVVTFHTPLEVVRESPNPLAFTQVVEWTNQAGDFDVAMNAGGQAVILRLTVQIEKFEDPDDSSAEADFDADGITDAEEAALASRGIPLGDPQQRDLLLVVGYSHADWALTPASKELLLTRFHHRGIRMYLADAPDDPLDLCQPGPVSGFSRDEGVSIEQVRAARSSHVFSHAFNYAQFLMLVGEPVGADFGMSELNRSPAQNIVCRSHLYALGADIQSYQAKCIMHELGHNLGLCHPTVSGPTDSCPSGSIPLSERDPSLTVMGSPAEDQGNPVSQAVNAWSRPLDYTPTQWINADLTRVRPPE
ncbi:MAG: hypothetical protein EYC70_03630 [Planctomycetota bacterium]|nr:MAG: hypothetical protein EYC70_03630 [Planctomycetota bacterium]